MKAAYAPYRPARPSLIQRITDGIGRAASLPAWQLCLILVPLVFISATLLRMNNLGMVERREAVLSADKAGDSSAVQRSLADLQSYASHHMNTDLGNGVYLQYSYDKAYDNALANAADTTNPNSAVYQQASIECRAKWQGGVASFRNDYVQCVVDRVSQLSPQAQKTATLPTADDYRFNFVSPGWSPDFAGIAVALCVIVGLLIVIKTIVWLILRMLVRRLYRRI